VPLQKQTLYIIAAVIIVVAVVGTIAGITLMGPSAPATPTTTPSPTTPATTTPKPTTPSPTTTPTPTTSPATTSPVTVAPTEKVIYLYGSWPPPENYITNPLVGTIGMLHYYTHMPLVFLVPAQRAPLSGLPGEYPKLLQLLADSWTFKVDPVKNVTIAEVKLKKTGWSNGDPVTAEDVFISVVYYGCFYNSFPGYYEVVDASTIRRHFNGTNIRFETLTSWMWSWYGVWASSKYYKVDPLWPICMEQYQLMKQRYYLSTTGQPIPKAITDRLALLNKWFKGNLTEAAKKVPTSLANGPFYPAKITESNIIWEKNPYFWNAPNIAISKWVMSSTPETAVIIEELGRGAVTWTTLSSLTPDLVDTIKALNPNLLIYPLTHFRMVGILFNFQRYPMNDTHFRRAVAYLMDRDKILAALPFQAKKPVLNIGLPEQFLWQWLSQDDLKAFTNYSYDPKKAEQEMLAGGFKKDTRTGKWLLPNGTPISITLTITSDYAIVAEAVASALNNFGISTQINVVPSAVWTTLVQTYATSYTTPRNYDITIWISSLMYATGHPYWTWSHILMLGWGAGGAIAFPNSWNIQHPWKDCTKDENISRLFSILYNNPGTDIEKCAVKAFAWIVNEYVPVYHLYESGVWVFMNSKDIKGWPSLDDPVWSVRLMDAGYYRALLLLNIYYLR